MQNDKEVITTNIARFPETFALRAYRKDSFRICPDKSFVDWPSNEVHLVTQRLVGDKWLDFARCSPAELRKEILSPKLPVVL